MIYCCNKARSTRSNAWVNGQPTQSYNQDIMAHVSDDMNTIFSLTQQGNAGAQQMPAIDHLGVRSPESAQTSSVPHGVGGLESALGGFRMRQPTPLFSSPAADSTPGPKNTTAISSAPSSRQAQSANVQQTNPFIGDADSMMGTSTMPGQHKHPAASAPLTTPTASPTLPGPQATTGRSTPNIPAMHSTGNTGSAAAAYGMVQQRLVQHVWASDDRGAAAVNYLMGTTGVLPTVTVTMMLLVQFPACGFVRPTLHHVE